MLHGGLAYATASSTHVTGPDHKEKSNQRTVILAAVITAVATLADLPVLVFSNRLSGCEWTRGTRVYCYTGPHDGSDGDGHRDSRPRGDRRESG